nr:DUF4435 domain-containing protein [uncultured Methanoregula sp.]
MNRDSRPAPVIATSIRLHRQRDPRAVLIVEGSTDSRVFGDFINPITCRFVFSSSREKAVQILDELEKDRFEGVLAIIDKDSDNLSELKWEKANLIYTDSHDLETMILSSDAFKKFLNEFGLPDKTKEENIEEFVERVRERLINASIGIGYLRWYSTPECRNLQLSFKSIDFEKIANKKEFTIQFDDAIIELRKKSSECKVKDFSKIKKEIETHIIKKTFDPWAVCSGHDMVAILTIFLKNGLGNKRCDDASSDCIDGALRLSFIYSHFQKTNVFHLMKKYESDNKPYCLLKE